MMNIKNYEEEIPIEMLKEKMKEFKTLIAQVNEKGISNIPSAPTASKLSLFT